MVTVRELRKTLENIKEELQDKDVKVVAENGLKLPAIIHYQKIDRLKLDLSKDNIECVIITW